MHRFEMVNILNIYRSTCWVPAVTVYFTFLYWPFFHLLQLTTYHVKLLLHQSSVTSIFQSTEYFNAGYIIHTILIKYADLK